MPGCVAPLAFSLVATRSRLVGTSGVGVGGLMVGVVAEVIGGDGLAVVVGTGGGGVCGSG